MTGGGDLVTAAPGTTPGHARNELTYLHQILHTRLPTHTRNFFMTPQGLSHIYTNSPNVRLLRFFLWFLAAFPIQGPVTDYFEQYFIRRGSVL